QRTPTSAKHDCSITTWPWFGCRYPSSCVKHLIQPRYACDLDCRLHCKRRHIMKLIVLLSTLLVASVFATTTFAQSSNTRRVLTNSPSNMYESYSLGRQTYPNPDRDYLGETRYPAPTR